MNTANELIQNLKGLGLDAIREEISSREAEIKALRVLLRATREATRSNPAISLSRDSGKGGEK